MDSEDLNLFSDANVKMVFAACRGFVSNLDGMLQRREIRFATTDYRGMKVREPAEDKRFLEAHRTNVNAEHPAFQNFVDALTFKRVASFDIYL
jgi:hypothetical protein